MYKKAIDHCFRWIDAQMLSFDRGRWGVYERICTDTTERIALSRPDTASEYIKAAQLYRSAFNDNAHDDVSENLLRWLAYAQNTQKENGNTAFPFSLLEGSKKYQSDKLLYQNDNGKLILNLLDVYEKSGEKRAKSLALTCADFWCGIQREDGCFHCENIPDLQPAPRGACFVLWLMAAMYACHAATGENKYLRCGRKAFGYVQSIIKGGRVLTSMETAETESWRPVSSENFIALLCLARCARCGEGEAERAIDAILPFCMGLIDQATGAVKNCDASSKAASLQNNCDMTDLVYTDGFALNALIELYRLKGDNGFLHAARKLADWLVSVQIDKAQPLIGGGWRGSYDLRLKKYAGRCGNALDEGGYYSIYTGWCALPNIIGMLKLEVMQDER